MKRIALAPLLLAALTFAPAASADHGHNCVWSGQQWLGVNCPGQPTFGPIEPTDTPAPTVTSEPTTPAPTPTTSTPAPSPTSTAPAPTMTTPAPTSTSTPQPTATPTSTRTGCLRSYGNEWCTGATPSTSTTTPAPVVGPLVETDIVHYAPEVNPARILR